jgi:hypothetical protein
MSIIILKKYIYNNNMKQQIFRILPDLHTLLLILSCFNIKNIKHDIVLDISKLDNCEILSSFNKIYDKLSQKYRKSVINKIYENLTIQKCITILKQNLEINNYKLIKINKLYYFKDIEYLMKKNQITIVFD